MLNKFMNSTVGILTTLLFCLLMVISGFYAAIYAVYTVFLDLVLLILFDGLLMAPIWISVAIIYGWLAFRLFDISIESIDYFIDSIGKPFELNETALAEHSNTLKFDSITQCYLINKKSDTDA